MKKKARTKDFESLWVTTPSTVEGEPPVVVHPSAIKQIKWFKDENPEARDWAEKRDLNFRDVGDKHPGTGDPVEVAGYYYISNTTKQGKYMGMTEPVYEIDPTTKVKTEVVAAEAIYAGIYELWNEGSKLDIDNEF